MGLLKLAGDAIRAAHSVEKIEYAPRDAASNNIIVYRHEIENFGKAARLQVAPNQVAIFVNDGECKVWQPGLHLMSDSKVSSSPFMQKILNVVSDGETIYSTKIYFINLVSLMDLKFGTADMIPVRDPEFGIRVRVRAAGLFGAHINNDDIDGVEVLKFFNKVNGSREKFEKTDLEAYLRGKIQEFLANLLGEVIGEKRICTLDLASHYTEVSKALQERMTPEFDKFGIKIDNFSVVNIKLLDSDLDILNEALVKRATTAIEAQGTAAAMTVESEALAAKRAREGYTYQQEAGFGVMKEAAGNTATMGSMMGLGVGFGMGGAMGGAMGNMANQTMGTMNNAPQQQAPQQAGAKPCPECGTPVPAGAKFCPNCGHKNGEFCPKCGAELAPGAKFCPSCGEKLTKVCPDCGTELAPGAKFCPNCGKKL